MKIHHDECSAERQSIRYISLDLVGDVFGRGKDLLGSAMGLPFEARGQPEEQYRSAKLLQSFDARSRHQPKGNNNNPNGQWHPEFPKLKAEVVVVALSIVRNPGKPNQRKASLWTVPGGKPEPKFDVNRACFPKEKHQNSQKWVKLMNFSFWPFLWFARATPDSMFPTCALGSTRCSWLFSRACSRTG